ncbi:hypothetical protein V6N11_082312 [Hibiscus sabdariffa]|uniref:Uncharacterized protein n=1 Tax=Hibiscus sabdariffa TaxID=183260 RepID=A0ABR2PCN8_9ROSI
MDLTISEEVRSTIIIPRVFSRGAWGTSERFDWVYLLTERFSGPAPVLELVPLVRILVSKLHNAPQASVGDGDSHLARPDAATSSLMVLLGAGIFTVFMVLLARNVRGLGNKDMFHAPKMAAFKYKTNIIFLSETKQKERYIEKSYLKMKFDNAFYVEPDEDKQDLWEMLASLRNDVNAKCCILGDYNVMVSPEEKHGGNPFDHNSAKWYYEFLDQTY